ncbi:MAG: c-type cytochrome [Chloroflexi bacterium]|nr:c-type cytochrome [Chloroflexota bacterium]
MKAERCARVLVILIAIGLPMLIVTARSAGGGPIELHGVMADEGGWTPGEITAAVGEPINLRLTSDDVVHGFAIGQSDRPTLDVMPGKWTTTTVIFDRPGKYTFYCTRWCGANHWRMRGTIEVTGDETNTPVEPPPLYAILKLDLDAPHLSEVAPDIKPLAARGAALNVRPGVAADLDRADAYRVQSPAQVWRQLRARASSKSLTDQQVWDLVALTWQSNTTPERLAAGKKLYAENCAACHGETGQGDGVMAGSLQTANPSDMPGMIGHATVTPIDFTDARNMLGANSALLQGKIVRGGMGTGMPYWGPIFTEAQTWALIDYLWTFQFE